ncbi:MAG: site-2 protease family protein [Anaerolineales bacterium]|nr:site-2 protease family protein [Anaerolineales bacterium]
MLLLQAPPPTRFDLNFTLFGFPIQVHPLFWVIGLLFGASSTNLISILLWVFTIFISILIHELGHALAMRYYGQSSRIVLHGAGGVTIPESVAWGSRYANVALTPNQQILISFAGPGAGFLLALLIMLSVAFTGGVVVPNAAYLFGIVPFPYAHYPNGSALINSLVMTFLWVNVFWGLVNLLPVYPLDGGHIARYIILQFDPWNGLQKSLWLSVYVGAAIALLSLIVLSSTYMALLFGLLAFQSYQILQSRSPL